MSDPACIRCGAPRAPGPECPRCGVIYARAEQRRAAARDTEAAGDALAPPPARPSAAALFARQESLQDARAELWLARLAVPIALLSAWLLVHTNMGGFLLRTFCSMWLHELGHAVAAWLCGFPALPGPWLTHVGEERSLVFGILITAGLGHVAWRAWTKPDRALTAAVAGVLALQLVGSLMLRATTARTLITFAGDAGGLLFGAALMATFFVPPEHKLHRDWLRWGFLVIGAAGFADVFHVWWAARSDYSMIPFGEYEHGGPTDPSKLVMEGWTIPAMINRYLGLGVLGLLVLVPLQVLHVRRTRAKLEALEAGLEQPDSSVRNSA